VTPDSLIDPATLVVSDRVRVELTGNLPVVRGRSGGLNPASTALRGTVELATDAETITGADAGRAVTPAGLAAVRALPVRGVVPSSVVVGSGSASVASDGTITFTGVSSVSLNDVFDGLGGDVYRVVLNIATGTDMRPGLRYRASGTDNSSSIYDSQVMYAIGTSVSATTNGSQTSHIMGIGARDYSSGTLDIMSPALADNTAIKSEIWQGDWGNANTGIAIRTGFFRSALVFDGITIFPSTGTMTGTMKVVKVS